MKVGDYLLCKRDIFDDIVICDSVVKHKFSPIFKKGKRYRIIGIEHYSYSNSGATYGGIAPADYIFFRFKECAITSFNLFHIFYTQKEERNLKLKKIEYGI